MYKENHKLEISQWPHVSHTLPSEMMVQPGHLATSDYWLECSAPDRCLHWLVPTLVRPWQPSSSVVVEITPLKHMGPGTKLYLLHFVDKKFFIWAKFSAPKVSMAIMSAFVSVMGWWLTGRKALPKPIITQFSSICVYALASFNSMGRNKQHNQYKNVVSKINTCIKEWQDHNNPKSSALVRFDK